MAEGILDLFSLKYELLFDKRDININGPTCRGATMYPDINRITHGISISTTNPAIRDYLRDKPKSIARWDSDWHIITAIGVKLATLGKFFDSNMWFCTSPGCPGAGTTDI